MVLTNVTFADTGLMKLDRRRPAVAIRKKEGSRGAEKRFKVLGLKEKGGGGGGVAGSFVMCWSWRVDESSYPIVLSLCCAMLMV